MYVTQPRLFSLIPVIAIIGLLAYALYTEYYLFLSPCNLCMVQRYIFLAIGILFFTTFIFNPKGLLKGVFGCLMLLFTALGLGVAGRHVWLTTLPPDEVPDCGPGLDYMLDAFPLSDILKELFNGSGDCAKTIWDFMGLSMPAWSLICFIGLFIYTIFWILIKQRKSL